MFRDQCLFKMLTFVFFLLVLLNVSVAVKHSLKYFMTAVSGYEGQFELTGSATVDDTQITSCTISTIIKTLEIKQDWVRRVFTKNPQHLELYTQECVERQPNVLRATLINLKQRLNQSNRGFHFFQNMRGCEWDDETGELSGFMRYAYDGEDFIAFDQKTSTWIAPTAQAFSTKLKWDADKVLLKDIEIYFTEVLPEWLKTYLDYGKSSLRRTDLPSVSLLQKTPSSPITCHATGFYPKKAVMLWRRDGQDLPEAMEHSEVLPNNDGSFQMSVDLKLPADTPAGDWERYECVFQLSGVKDDLSTKLKKDLIKTNYVEPSDMSAIIIIIAVVFASFFLIVATGFITYRNRRAPEIPD